AQHSVAANSHAASTKGVVVLVFSADVKEGRDRDGRDQNPMFVHQVNLVKGPQGVIPSLVRLYRIEDRVHNVRPRNLYLSIQRGYHFLRSLQDGKTEPPCGDPAGLGHNLPGDVVKGGAQVMDGIANEQRDFIGQWLGFKLQDVDALIVLDTKSVEVRFQKGVDTGLQITDVMFGPFDL